MTDSPKDDEAKFNDTLKRMLKTPPKPHKDKDRSHDGADENAKKEREK